MDAQADLSLRCAHSHIVGFVMRWLTCLHPPVEFFFCPFKDFGSDVVRVLYCFVVAGHRDFSRIVWFCTYVLLYPPHKKVAGYYVIPSEKFEILSVCPSVSASFPDSNLNSF